MVVESIVRLNDDDVRVRLPSDSYNFTLHTDSGLIENGSAPAPLPIPAGCDDPCDLTLWSVYRTSDWASDGPPVDLFGDAEVLTSTPVLLERAVAEVLTVEVSEQDVANERTRVEFCATTDAEFETELRTTHSGRDLGPDRAVNNPLRPSRAAGRRRS